MPARKEPSDFAPRSSANRTKPVGSGTRTGPRPRMKPPKGKTNPPMPIRIPAPKK